MKVPEVTESLRASCKEVGMAMTEAGTEVLRSKCPPRVVFSVAGC